MVDLSGMKDVGVSVGPTGYYLPKAADCRAHADRVTMRRRRPIVRNTSPVRTPITSRCRAVPRGDAYNRLTEIGLAG